MAQRYYTKTAHKKRKAATANPGAIGLFGKGYTKTYRKGKSVTRSIGRKSYSKGGTKMIIGSHQYNAMKRKKGR